MNIQCVFVNTDQKPVKIERTGYFHVRTDFSNRKYITELCEVFYPHPDAPEHAIVSVFRYLEVTLKSKELIPSIEAAEKAIKGFKSVTSLEKDK